MVYILIVFIIVLLDYFSKKFIKNNYPLNKKTALYKDNIFILHIKNNGFAYGLFKNFQKFICPIIFIFLCIVIFLFGKSLKEDSILKKLALAFALGGGLGNFIDRVKNKNVTDFIYIKFKNAPIFNIADFFIILSPILYSIAELKDFILKK